MTNPDPAPQPAPRICTFCGKPKRTVCVQPEGDIYAHLSCLRRQELCTLPALRRLASQMQCSV
jgi:hypothetical protein